jgi:phenylpropionate dioxygenase-like ring-hydroxylating dioxygenase large terminal subunit
MTSVIQESSYFTCLPREYYTDPARYQRELDLIFSKQWRYFGHISEVPETGDYLVRDISAENVIVARGEDGELNGFLNVCRHRGSRLTFEVCGKAKSFSCPYHGWRYDLTGALRNAPTMLSGNADFDFADYGLYKVQIEVWKGFIFICTGEEPLPSISKELDRAKNFDRIGSENIKLIAREEKTFKSNWKLVLENFLECYHCATAHPEFSEVVDVFGQFSTMGEEWEIGEYIPDACNLLKEGMKTWAPNGEYVCQTKLGEFAKGVEPEQGFAAAFLATPAVWWLCFYPDFGVTQHLEPVSVEETRWVTNWWVNKDAVEGRDYNVEELTALLKLVNEQDREICDGTQLGMHSHRFKQGPNSARAEAPIRGTLTTYLQMMGEEA